MSGSYSVNAPLRQLARLMAGYSLASLLGPVFTVVLTPLYTRVLHPGDYAILDVLSTLSGLGTSLASLGMSHALTVFYYDQQASTRPPLVSTALVLILGGGVVAWLVLWFMAPGLAAGLLGSQEAVGLVRLLAILVPLMAVGLLMQTTLRLQMAVRRANILAIGNLLLTVGLTVVFVLGLNLGIWGVQLALAIAAGWLALGGIMLVGGVTYSRPDPGMLRPLLLAGLGALPGLLAVWALAVQDRLLLPLYGVAAEQRGLYAIAGKLASILAIVIMPFQTAWTPLALSMRAAPNAHATYARVLRLFVAGGLGMALGLALFAHEILVVFTTPAYLGAAPLVALLAYGTVSNGITSCVAIGAQLERRTEVMGMSLLIGAILNLLLNLLLIPLAGIWGAAWATLLGYAIVPVVVYVWAQRIHTIPYQPWRLLTALLIQVSLLLAAFQIGIQAGSHLGWRILLMVLYPLLLVATGMIERTELRALVQRLRQVR